MNDALLMCSFKRLGNLFGDGQRLIDRNRPLRDAVCERRPFDQLHDERLHAVRLLKAVDVGDVRMVQRGEDLRLSLESSESVRVRREGIGQHLQGIVPLEPRVMRSPDLAHAALANQGGDFIGAEAAAGADGHVRGFYAIGLAPTGTVFTLKAMGAALVTLCPSHLREAHRVPKFVPLYAVHQCGIEFGGEELMSEWARLIDREKNGCLQEASHDGATLVNSGESLRLFCVECIAVDQSAPNIVETLDHPQQL